MELNWIYLTVIKEVMRIKKIEQLLNDKSILPHDKYAQSSPLTIFYVLVAI